MKKLIQSILLLSAAIGSAQEANYIFYNHFQNIVNPAAITAANKHTIDLHLRYQWAQSTSSDSPQQQTLNTTHRLSNHVAIGASVVREKVFIQQQTALFADFAYALPLSETQKLYLGIKAGGNLFNIDGTRFKTYNDQYEPYLQGISARFQPNVGVGAYYEQPQFYVGISAPNLLATNKTKVENEVVTSIAERTSFYAQAGYFYPLNTNFTLSPRAQAYINQKGNYQLNASAAVLYSNYLEAALGYRTDTVLNISALFKIPAYHISIGYGFETNLDSNIGSSLRNFHEFMVKVYW